MPARPVALITDFGHRDPFVGICHGVILREDPTIPIIDVSHGVERQDIRAGSSMLADAAPYMPADCVIVAVVDPEVGSNRRAVAVECERGAIVIGPDNGLLFPTINVLGGARSAYEISKSPWILDNPSNTFHGRDLFAAVAAKLAVGQPIALAGSEIGTRDLKRLPTPHVEWSGETLVTSVQDVDTFGNVRLAGHMSDVGEVFRGESLTVQAGGEEYAASTATAYSDGEPGQLLLLEDSSRSLSLAINQGSAATKLGIRVGESVRIARR
jgi:S-adenosylmethionine hydrolase